MPRSSSALADKLQVRQQRGDRRQAGMLADHDAIRAAEQQRIERLVGALVLQQAVDMDAGFVGEDMVAHDGLVERNGARRGRGDDGGDVAEFGQHDAGLAPVQLPERDRDFFERRVAGALAKTDHGDRGMGGAGLDRRQRVGGGKAEIVMAVELEFEVGGRAQRRHQREARIRIEHAERIGDAKPPRAGGLRRGDDLDQEIDVGAGRVLAADRNRQGPCRAHSRRRA